MSKVYLIFNGNEIIDVVIDNKECAENTYCWIVKNNDNDYKIYELLEFEVNGLDKDINKIYICKLNGKPYIASKDPINKENEEYRKYTYEEIIIG